MHNQFSVAGRMEKFSKTTIAVMLVLTVTVAGATGYIFARSKVTVAAGVADDSASLAAYDKQVASENELCTVVEQLNLQQQLEAEQRQFTNLETALDAKQSEIDDIMVTITDTLMANLNKQSISRSSKSASAYRQEGINLIALRHKLNDFLNSEAAHDIDLSEYQNALLRRLSHIPTIKPIPGDYGGYGYRIHPIYGNYQFHPAADVGAATGTSIKAAADGTVTYSGWSSGSGYNVKINHGNGFLTIYMHCSKLLVSAGQTVHKGDVIALVGSTGSSTAPHLHYEIHFNDSTVNPATMLLE